MSALGLRRGRCDWCARPLRWWQVWYCRSCWRGAPLRGVLPGAHRDAPADGGPIAWLAGHVYDHGRAA